ncbi:NAD-dependent epimerase/dehydratase family protein [Flavihumibacter sp. R14]|nr:NAD-dependent epimerase/dehydratase family protein [Flavihumibacter soli]
MENYFKNKKILITGGLGFLGSNLADRLSSFGADITLIDNLNPLYGGNPYNVKHLEGKVNIVIEDMRDIETLKPLIEKTDIIFHLAAQVSYIDSLSMPYEDLDLNATATLNILECCRQVNRNVKIVFSSSRMVYGKVEQELLTENSPVNPLSLYGVHKLTSEKYLLMYYKDFGIPCTILRLTNPYGPKQQIKHSKYSLVGWFIRQAIEGNTIKIFGEGSQLRDYIFVDDIVTAMLKCAASPAAIGEVINVGSGHSTKFSDMVHAVVNCVKNGKVEYVSWPANYEKIETGDIRVDFSKLKSITSWQPEFSLEEGIERTFKYYSQFSSHYV